ncbi:MAG: DUF4900 domain-containing protein [Candidatus Xenobium sp.]|jgi:hypothetical protein|nr:DUF4900 domain-containing protein [Burkholderiales bacterium]
MRIRGRFRPGGFALAMALFLILILATLSYGSLSIATLDSRTARENQRASQAMYAARAGIALALSKLSYDYNWTSGSGSLSEDAGAPTCSVQVVPAASNPTETNKIWKVTSTGHYQEAQRRLSATVALESFARFAYFTEQEFSIASTPIYFGNRDKLDGAVHTNGYFSIAGRPQFASRVTSANTADSRYDSGRFSYNQEGIQYRPSRFYRTNTNYATDYPMALDSSPDFSFAGGQSRIQMPTDTGEIRRRANHSYDGTHEFKFRDDGTVQIRRRSGNRWVYVETIRTDTSPGVTIYAKGETWINGTVKGRVTFGATEDIHINGNLVYENPNRDVLGIVGQKDLIVEASNSAVEDRYIHGVMMALNGSFRVANYDSGTYRGILHVYGGIIQARRGPVGTFSGTTMRTGYTKNYVYDKKLANTPPLNFPTTGSLEIRSLIDHGSLGGA